MTHPDTDVLAEFRAGLITGRRGARITAHLAGCARCADQLKQLQSTINVMRADNSESAPRDVVSYAVNLFGRRATQPSLAGRIIATLSFDSFQHRPQQALVVLHVSINDGDTTGR